MQFAADPVVRAFDLRMQRQLPPLPVELPPSATGVRFLRFMRSPDAQYSEGAANAVAMVTEEGVLQITDLLSESSVPQVLYAPIADVANEFLTACAVSPSGQFLSVGTSHGAFAQFMHCSAELDPATGEKALQRVNEVSSARCVLQHSADQMERRTRLTSKCYLRVLLSRSCLCRPTRWCWARRTPCARPGKEK